MKSWVCAVTEDVGLIPVGQEIVNVTHLMMCRDKPALRYLSALFYSEKDDVSKLSNRWANKRTKKHEAKEKEKKEKKEKKERKKVDAGRWHSNRVPNKRDWRVCTQNEKIIKPDRTKES